MLTAYELERLANIESNQQKLEALGLKPSEPLPSQRRGKRPRPDPAPPSEPTRKSNRVAVEKAPTERALSSGGERVTDIPPWEQAVFKQCQQNSKRGHLAGTIWDAKKHHQHLTLSADGRAVATTGVAGYGAALVRRAPACRRWAVRAVRFGTGGFGVGVVRASMKPPFKSIGKSAQAIGAYLASGVFATHGDERLFGPPYGPGDLIEVELRPSARGGAAAIDLFFSLNGSEVGLAASSVAGGADGLVLAVQPYMGGVTLLES